MTIKQRFVASIVAIALIMLAYIGYREYARAGALLVPAIILRNADAQAALEPGLVRRAVRLIRGAPPLSSRPKLIALTFDDGPYPVSTPLLLDTLADLHVPATFFLIGHTGREFPELARRILAAGDEIANHTLTHPNLTRLPPDAIRSQLMDAALILQPYTADASPRSMMRPPGGRFTLATIKAIQQAGYDIILWSDDPGDWEGFTATQMLRHIEQKASAPEILLLHSGILPAVAMLPDLVARFRAAGYTFVTVEDLLARTSVDVINNPARHPL